MKISIIGTIDETHTIVSGQYDRTEVVVEGLKNAGYNVKFTNMINWRKNPICIIYNIIKNYFWCDAFIFVSWINGAKVNLQLWKWLRIISKRPAFQIAIGGKQNCDYIRQDAKYRELVKQLDAVFVELQPMVDEYIQCGIERVVHLPNCKRINRETSRNTPEMEVPFRFCTYSRVMPEKGVKEAVEAVERLNQKYGIQYCTLDIYGTYNDEDRQWFENIMSKASDSISYKGRIERKDSISVLGQYDLMLFPTRYVNEGVPGSMIDCYEAGLPIVVSNTTFVSTIVIDSLTGFVYDDADGLNLDKAILRYTEDLSTSEKIEMRKRCISMAMKYDTSAVIDTLSQYLESIKESK